MNKMCIYQYIEKARNYVNFKIANTFGIDPMQYSLSNLKLIKTKLCRIGIVSTLIFNSSNLMAGAQDKQDIIHEEINSKLMPEAVNLFNRIKEKHSKTFEIDWKRLSSCSRDYSVTFKDSKEEAVLHD